ncbi:hypothetical protein EDO6_04663 [Paenibacillus xylanexedens]|nr:hypothetical protein EDO6_04663 [Paenibacillus xylanexedens]
MEDCADEAGDSVDSLDVDSLEMTVIHVLPPLITAVSGLSVPWL